jgi:hypothetical protein
MHYSAGVLFIFWCDVMVDFRGLGRSLVCMVFLSGGCASSSTASMYDSATSVVETIKKNGDDWDGARSALKGLVPVDKISGELSTAQKLALAKRVYVFTVVERMLPWGYVHTKELVGDLKKKSMNKIYPREEYTAVNLCLQIFRGLMQDLSDHKRIDGNALSYIFDVLSAQKSDEEDAAEKLKDDIKRLLLTKCNIDSSQYE